jgi:hypothetical protein
MSAMNYLVYTTNMDLLMIKIKWIRDSEWKKIGPYKSLFGKTNASGRFEEIKEEE